MQREKGEHFQHMHTRWRGGRGEWCSFPQGHW